MEVGNVQYEDYLDATNRFFTLIPHNFGMNKLPLLNSQELLIVRLNYFIFLIHLKIFRLLTIIFLCRTRRNCLMTFWTLKLHIAFWRLTIKEIECEILWMCTMKSYMLSWRFLPFYLLFEFFNLFDKKNLSSILKILNR